MKKLESDY